MSSQFNLSADIVTDATFTATLTTLANAPLGSITLSGTVEQEVLGRTTSTEDPVRGRRYFAAMSLSGPVLGHTLTVMLDPSNTSSGTTSIDLTPVTGRPNSRLTASLRCVPRSFPGQHATSQHVDRADLCCRRRARTGKPLLAGAANASDAVSPRLSLAMDVVWRGRSPKRRTIASLSSVQM